MSNTSKVDLVKRIRESVNVVKEEIEEWENSERKVGLEESDNET